MKVFLISFLTVLTMFDSCQVLSQSQGVEFQNLSWEQALEAAKKQNKFLFVDVVRSIKDAAQKSDFDKQVDKAFSVDSLAGLINDNFLSIKMDMSSEEGKTFGPKLQMLMYPAYVFYNTEGDQIGNSNSYELVKNPGEFIDKVYHAVQKGELKKENNGVIDFLGNKDSSWESVLERAVKEKKPVFIDAYTTWCRPCIQMDRDIFTLNEVADFHNKNFINLKLDGGKTYGPELVKKFGIRGFPSFIYVDAKGKVIHSDSGFKEKDAFLNLSKEALNKFDKKTPKINFLEQAPFIEVQRKAKRQKKPIFFDAYTTWCGPCKQMDKQVFTNPEVADFFNSDFINAKYDMEKGEGISLKTKYEVSAYPTYLILDDEGNVLHRYVGAMSPEEFIKFGETGKSESSLSKMRERYEAGARDKMFILEYILSLKNAYLTTEASQVADTYFMGLSESDKLLGSTWNFIGNYIVSPNTEAIRYIVANRANFTTNFGDEVESKLYNVYLGGARQFAQLNEKNELIDYDKKGFVKYLKEVEKLGLTKYDQFEAYAWIGSYRTRSDWDNYVSAIDKYMDQGTIDRGVFSVYNYALVVERNADDAALREIASDWIIASEGSAPEYYKDPLSKLKEKLSGPLSEN
ncbi:MAG: thioredoxin family protein [Reichenbachiella sp.]|uniref:thioredoxin family protein n=1 Tax=Reichenbachiella sp. TaxID=2184521 RepID=UPI003266E74B